MKGNKYKIIVSTLILLCLCSVPVYALSLSYDSEITSLGSYVGGWSYTTGSGYDYYEVDSYLFEDGDIVDSDHDNDPSWAQGDVGINNPSGIQHWVVHGYHTGWIQGVDINKTSYDYGDS
jgi:hypothetical protein